MSQVMESVATTKINVLRVFRNTNVQMGAPLKIENISIN